MNTTKSKRAELARQHGQLWESHTKKECRDLKRARRAVVRKNHEAKNIPGSHIKREQSKPDFSGFQCETARHIVFENKASLVTTRFDFDNITDGQFDHLTLAHAAGAIAFVYVLDGKRRRWLLPIPLIQACKDAGASSFSYRGDDRFQKVRGETWLDTWHRLERENLT